MSKQHKKEKKMVKRAIRDSLVSEEVDSADVECEGGDISAHESCISPVSLMSTDMSCLCIILNVFFPPIGTFLASGLDKRGCNMKLLAWGIIYSLPFVIM